MKSILFIHASSDLYGSDRSLLRTVENLDKKQFRTIVVLPYDGYLVEEFKAIGVPVYIYNLAVLRKKHFNLAGLFYLFYHFIRSFFYLRKMAKREEVDAIYANTSTVPVGAVVAASLGVSYITHLREAPLGPLFYKKILGAYMGKFSTKMIAVSEATRETWVQFVGGTDIDVINNGIEPQSVGRADLRKELQLPSDALVIGTVARIHPVKGISYFLEMAKEINGMNANIFFILIGDHFKGYERYVNEVHQYVKDHQLTERVIFLGFKKEPLSYVKDFDIFILSSIKPDPFPTVILEAFSQKVPVVATRQGGAEEMIEHGVNGMLVPLDNASEGVKQIYSLVTDENKRKEMGQLAFEKFQTHYTLEVYSKKINAYLHSL